MSNTRRRSARWLALAVLALCLLVPSVALAAAKPSTGVIKGAVSGFDTARLKGVSVVAFAMTGTPGQTDYDSTEVARTTTGNNGTFTLRVAPGTYRIGFFPASPDKYAWEYHPGVPVLPAAEDVIVTPRATVRGVDATLDQAGRISGTVVDEGGNPIEGARVTLHEQWGGRPEPVMSTFADADGAFDFTGLPVDEFGLWFMDPNGWHLAATTWRALETPGQQVLGVEMVLTNAGVVSGTVVDGAGDPVAGIQVVPYFFNEGMGGGWWEARYDLFAETGADGTYRLGGLMAGEVSVRFSDESGRFAQEFYDDAIAPSMAAAVLVMADVEHTGVDATLSAGGSISGTVMTPDGPYSGWGVGISAWATDHWEDVGGVAVDEAGTYSARLPLGRYRVYFACDDWNYVPEYWNNTLDPNLATPVDLTVHNLNATGIDAMLARPSHLTGHLTDEVTGDPLANITVGAGVQMGTDWWGHVSWAYTDANGYYDIPVSVGTFRVQFWDDNGVYIGEAYNDVVGQTDPSAGEDITVADEGQVVAGLDASLARAGHIKGRLTNADAEPIVGFGVAAGTGSNWDHVAWTETGEDGTYDLVVAAGTYRVNFCDWNGVGYLEEWFDDVTDVEQGQSLTVSAGQDVTGIDAILASPAFITGRVTDYASAGLGGIQVSAHLPSSDPEAYPQYLTGVETDSDGFYRLAVVPGTSVIVEFSDQTNNSYLSEWYGDVADWQSATVLTPTIETPVEYIDAVLAQGAHISGRVTDGAGNGIADIDVSAQAPAMNPEEGPQWCGGNSTDGDGYYDLVVSPGEYLVQFSDWQNRVFVEEWYDDAGQDWQAATPVTTSITTPAVNINAVLGRGAHITGHVTDADGVPIVGIGVGVSVPPEQGSQDGPMGIGGGETDDNGDYDIMVPEGTYLVNFGIWNNAGYLTEWFDGVRNYIDATPVSPTPDTPANNVNASLEGASFIEGRVTGPSGGGIGGVMVSIATQGEFWWQMNLAGGAETNSEGYYSAPVEAGTYLVGFTPPDRTVLAAEWYGDQLVWQAGTPVVVATGATTGDINAVLSVPGTISGRVTDSNDNPVVGLQVVNAVEVGTDQWSWFNQVFTDANGEYTLHCHPGEVLVGFVDQSNYWAEQWYPGAGWPGGGTLQTLTEGGAVTGVDAVMLPRTP